MMTVRRFVRHLMRMGKPPVAEVIFDARCQSVFPGVPMDRDRAQNIAAFLALERLVDPSEFRSAVPASMRALRRVHSDAYLESLREPAAMARAFGMEMSPADTDLAVAHQRHVTGGTSRAVRLATQSRGLVVHLGGGFHHAGPDQTHGFCLFNDIAVAIRGARANGFAGNVLVVDVDIHDGDGTRLCFRDDPTVHTYSVHNHTMDSTPAIEATTIALGTGVRDQEYLSTLNDTLPALFDRVVPSLVILVLGTDPAHDDKLGDWHITERGLLERDRLVTRLALSRPGTAVVTLFAGGYSGESWRYTARWLGEVLSGHLIEPPSSHEVTLARLRLVQVDLPRRDAPSSTGFDVDLSFSEADLLGARDPQPTERFLNYYPREAIDLAFERYGIFERLRSLGYERPTITWNLEDAAGHAVRVLAAPREEGASPELLIEFVLRRDRAIVPGFEMLYVEWLLLQNPRATPTRGLLPGQRHPGLGLLNEAIALLVMVSERLHLDGLALTPMHYHLHALGRPRMRCADPEREALARALAATGEPPALLSRALGAGRVRSVSSGDVVFWTPCVIVLPISGPLKARLESDDYERDVAAHPWAITLSEDAALSNEQRSP